eukprot:s23_g75.t1
MQLTSETPWDLTGFGWVGLVYRMAKHSWPAAVTSCEDTVKFAQLLFGTGVRVENYGDRLPHESTESFLLFAKGACKAPEPFSCIVDLIPKQFAEIENYEKTWRNNVQNPRKSQQILGSIGRKDRCSTYPDGDPITSFSFGHGGILTLSAATRTAPGTMLFQEHGDVLIMAGKFQTEFLHGVPERERWRSLCDGPIFSGMQAWEQQGMREEVELHRPCQGTGRHLRYNCTLRWHDTHWVGCPEHKPEPVIEYAAASGSLPVVAGSGRSLQQTVLVGLKKRSVEAPQEITGMEAAKSHRTVGVLLNCLGVMAKQDDVLWEMIKSLPLVDGAAPAVRCLREMEKIAMGQRNDLLRASEAALELGVDLPECINYASLNVIATATQQRREIQEIFGGLSGQGSMWVREVVCSPFCNLLRDEMAFRKLRLTH